MISAYCSELCERARGKLSQRAYPGITCHPPHLARARRPAKYCLQAGSHHTSTAGSARAAVPVSAVLSPFVAVPPGIVRVASAIREITAFLPYSSGLDFAGAAS
jgi:hypothetical protein